LILYVGILQQNKYYVLIQPPSSDTTNNPTTLSYANNILLFKQKQTNNISDIFGPGQTSGIIWFNPISCGSTSDVLYVSGSSPYLYTKNSQTNKITWSLNSLDNIKTFSQGSSDPFSFGSSQCS